MKSETDDYKFEISGVALVARPSAALWLPGARALVVSDLHLGKSERIARRSGQLLPPYENRETLMRLDAEIQRTGAETVICLGDSFDDSQAADSLPQDERLWITRLQAGRRWIWIAGNHDPGPIDLGGEHLTECQVDGLNCRHVALAGATAEISGHYHPKFTLVRHGQRISRPCFIHDGNRVILPAFGAFTGGLDCTAAELTELFSPPARVVTTGPSARAFPLPCATSTAPPRSLRGSRG